MWEAPISQEIILQALSNSEEKKVWVMVVENGHIVLRTDDYLNC